MAMRSTGGDRFPMEIKMYTSIKTAPTYASTNGFKIKSTARSGGTTAMVLDLTNVVPKGDGPKHPIALRHTSVAASYILVSIFQIVPVTHLNIL